MRQSAGLLVALLVATVPIPAAPRAPRDVDFTEYLQKSGLTHLYVAELRNLCTEGNDLRACSDYLSFLKRDGRAAQAVAFTDSISRESPHAGLAIRLLKAEALIDASRYSEAATILDEIIASLPPKEALVEATFLRAECWFGLGRIEEALVNLRAAEPCAAGSQAAEFAVLLARCEEAEGDLLRAETIYEEVLEQQGSADAALGLLGCRLKRGDIAGFFDERAGLERHGTLLPPGPTSELATNIGELIPEVWHALMGPVIIAPDLGSVADSAMVGSLARLAEAGEPVDRYCDSLLVLDLAPALKDKVRYAWALSKVESAWAADTLASLAGRSRSADLRLRCAAAAITRASDDVRPALAAQLAPTLLASGENLAGDERLELASMLIDSGLAEDGVRLAYRVLGDPKRAPEAARVEIAALLERSGDTGMARSIFEAAGASLIPTESSLEARKRAFILRDAVGTAPAADGLADDVERIAREGASDLELGDLFTRLKDFERASKHYRKASARPPEGTDAGPVKIKLITSLCRQWIETGDDELRSEALGLLDDIADSPAVGAEEVRMALDLATDWLRIDRNRALRIVQKMGSRDDLTSSDLYHNARILYSLFLKRDGNVYAECVLTLREILEEYPESPEAPAAAVLLGKAKFVAGDYVGALEAYESCLAEDYDDDEVTRLCRTGIGECYLYSGGFRDALARFTEAAGPHEALYSMGRCLELVGKADSAEACYRELLSRLPDHRLADAARLRLGLLAIEVSGLDAAMAETDSPIPAVRERLYGLRSTVRAYGLGRAGYRDMAIAELERLAGEGGRFACDALLLAASLAAWDEPRRARSLLEPAHERCADIFGIISLLEDRASYACSGGSLEACSEAGRAFKKRFPLAAGKHLGMELKTLLLLFREGEGDSASVLLESLKKRGQGHDLMAQAIYRRGIDHMIAGDYANAVEAFSAVQRDYPTHDLYHDACFKLGYAYYMTGNYDSSAMYFDLASESEKASLVEDAFFNLGLALEKDGDLARASQAFWSLAIRFPLSERFDRSLMRSAYALERAGRPREAIRIYRGLLNYAGDRETAAEAVYWMGESFSETGDHVRAAVEFLRLGHVFPGEAAWAGTACFRAGDECEAAGLKDHAIAIYRDNVRRFGEGTEWGKASAERLAELTGEGLKQEPSTGPGE